MKGELFNLDNVKIRCLCCNGETIEKKMVDEKGVVTISECPKCDRTIVWYNREQIGYIEGKEWNELNKRS